MLVFWNGGRVEKVKADSRPFQADSNAVEARYYGDDVGTIRFAGRDRYGRPKPVVFGRKTQDTKEALKEACENLLRPNAIIPFRPKKTEPIIEEIP